MDQWRHQQSQQLSKDLVQKVELSLLIEMLKSDIQTSMRSHFEIFKNETEGGITRKVEQKDLQEALSKKISSLEFWREIDYVKSMIHTVSRDLALAGLAGQTSGVGDNKPSSNSAIKTLIRCRRDLSANNDETQSHLDLANANTPRDFMHEFQTRSRGTARDNIPRGGKKAVNHDGNERVLSDPRMQIYDSNGSPSALYH